MSTYKSTATIECAACHVPMTGPENPQPQDLITCPQCGGQIEMQKAVDQAGKQFVSDVERQLKDMFKNAGFR